MPGLNEWIKFENDYCSFDFSKLKILNKKQAIDNVVEEVTKKSNNLYLALSGGLDSEFAANCLFDRGVKFVPIIMDIGSNKVENWYAYKWCHEKKIKPLIISLSPKDIIRIFPKIIEKWNIPFYCCIPIILSEIVTNKSGNLILGGEEIVERDFFLKGEFEKMPESLVTYDYAFCLEVQNKNHIGGFLSFTPELFLNCLEKIDYSKPGQLSLSEYYGVMPRPKLNSEINLSLLPELLKIKQHLDSGKLISEFRVENKNDFVLAAKNNKIIKIFSKKVFL